jgi:DNA-binding MarR family transcriptional regulator
MSSSRPVSGGSSRDERAGWEIVESFYEWARLEAGAGAPTDTADPGFAQYFQGIAEARFVVRKVFRLVDEQARQAGIEPLEHQALIQIFGGPPGEMRVNDVADRLDIAPAFASRLIRALEGRGLVTRSASEQDRRITLVEISDAGRQLLAAIDRDVHVHVEYFQRSLSDSARIAALGIFSFYLGASPRVRDLERLFGARGGER